MRPGSPVPTLAPSTMVTGMMPPAVLVRNTSWAPRSSPAGSARPNPAACPAHQDVGDVVVQVLVGVAHVGAVENQSVIQQRAVAVLGLLHLIGQVGQAGHVVAVDLSVVGDALGILGVVGSAVETAGGTA